MIPYHGEFNLDDSCLCLDIGGGKKPWQRADVVADLYLEPAVDNGNKKLEIINGRLENKLFVNCNIEDLPFKDKSFDFIYCSHTLEHVLDPLKACKELIRCGKRGYIAAPTYVKEVLIGETYHKWLIHREGNKLIFIRKLEADISDARLERYFRKMYFQNTNGFYDFYHKQGNSDIWYVEFLWQDNFEIEVIN